MEEREREREKKRIFNPKHDSQKVLVDIKQQIYGFLCHEHNR